MRSFTSSFDRAPTTRGVAFFCVAALTAIVLFVAIEAFWHSRGAKPGYADDPPRWSYYREKVDKLDHPKATVLIGGSRIQLGWSLDEFRSMLPGTDIIQLAMTGKHPWATLEDLSRNTDFAGVVIVALTAPALLPENHDDSAGRVAYFEEVWTTDKAINFLIDDFFQEHLVTRQPYYGLGQSIRSLVHTGRLLRGVNFIQITKERSSDVDYELIDIAMHRAERIRRVRVTEAQFQTVSAELWTESVRALDHLVRPMLQRGAKVVFIRFPTSDEHWAADQRMYPRNKYWDYMASHVDGQWIHFQDVEGLDRFVLPDTSHLDQRDKAAFTRIVVGRLRDLGIY